MLTDFRFFAESKLRVVALGMALSFLCLPINAQVIEKDVVGADGVRSVHIVPKGVCATAIDVQFEQNTIKSIKYTGGCPGTNRSVNAALKGMKTEDAVRTIDKYIVENEKKICPGQIAKFKELSKALVMLLEKDGAKSVKVSPVK